MTSHPDQPPVPAPGMDLKLLAYLSPGERELLRRAARRAARMARDIGEDDRSARWEAIAEAIYPAAQYRADIAAAMARFGRNVTAALERHFPARRRAS